MVLYLNYSGEDGDDTPVITLAGVKPRPTTSTDSSVHLLSDNHGVRTEWVSDEFHADTVPPPCLSVCLSVCLSEFLTISV